MRDGQGRTLLMSAAIFGKKHIVALLSKRDHDLSVVNDHSGCNALHFIVGKITEGVDARELLESLDKSQLSIDIVNKKDKSSVTPLHRAAELNMHKTIDWLLQNGADSTIKNKYGDRPEKNFRCNEKTKQLIKNFRK